MSNMEEMAYHSPFLALLLLFVLLFIAAIIPYCGNYSEYLALHSSCDNEPPLTRRHLLLFPSPCAQNLQVFQVYCQFIKFEKVITNSLGADQTGPRKPTTGPGGQLAPTLGGREED